MNSTHLFTAFTFSWYALKMQNLIIQKQDFWKYLCK